MTASIGRRTFVAGLGSAAAACSFAARAQEPGRIYRIGFLIPTPRDRPAVAALFDALRLHGFVEHQNLEVLPGGFGVRNEELTEPLDFGNHPARLGPACRLVGEIGVVPPDLARRSSDRALE